MIKKVLLVGVGLVLLGSCGSSGMQVTDIDPEWSVAQVEEALCVTTKVNGVTKVVCESLGIDIVVSDGSDGRDGSDGINGDNGQDGYFVSSFDPCGDELAHDELLYLDRDGNYHAWFQNVGHVILNQMTKYRTTDGSNCRFYIDTNGNVIDNL